MHKFTFHNRLQELYPDRKLSDILDDIEAMVNVLDWKEYKVCGCYMLYQYTNRLHIGELIVVDTLISDIKGQGTLAIDWLKRSNPTTSIQLDCKLDNTAIEFYKKQGFVHRANSLLLIQYN